MSAEKNQKRLYTGEISISSERREVLLWLYAHSIGYDEKKVPGKPYEAIPFVEIYSKPNISEQQELDQADIQTLSNTKIILAINHPESLLSLTQQCPAGDRASTTHVFNQHKSDPKIKALNAFLKGLSDENLLKVYKALKKQDDLHKKLYPFLDRSNLARFLKVSSADAGTKATVKQGSHPTRAAG